MQEPIVMPVDGTDIVRIVIGTDRLDVYNAPRLRDLTARLVHELKYRQILDLEGVHDADSTGLGVIVGAWQRSEWDHGGAFVLTNVGVKLRDTLKVTGLDKKLTIMPTVEDAVAFLSPLPASVADPTPSLSAEDRTRRLEADVEDARKTVQRAQANFDRLCNELAELHRAERDARHG